MPLEVEIELNPAFKPKDAEGKALVEKVRRAGKLKVDYTTAMENIRNSGGMYRIVPQAAPVQAGAAPDLETMSNESLKLMMANLGIKTEKVMKRPEIIKAIRLKLDDIQIVDDEDEDGA